MLARSSKAIICSPYIPSDKPPVRTRRTLVHPRRRLVLAAAVASMHSTGLLDGTRLTGPGSGPARTGFSLVLALAAVGDDPPAHHRAAPERLLRSPVTTQGHRGKVYAIQGPPAHIATSETATFLYGYLAQVVLSALRVGRRPRAANQPSISGSTRQQPYAGSSPAPLAWTVLAPFDPAKFGGPATAALRPRL
jgi:hypothetical protein